MQRIIRKMYIHNTNIHVPSEYLHVKDIKQQRNTVKMSMLYLINRIVATDYKQYY